MTPPDPTRPAMTEQRLMEIRERCAKATPGWWQATDLGPCDGWQIEVPEIATADGCIVSDGGDLTPENADFIAHAHQDLPNLLALCDSLRDALAASEVIVARLPKTRDGAPITPGMLLWQWLDGADNRPAGTTGLSQARMYNCDEFCEDENHLDLGDVYSTKEAMVTTRTEVDG